MSLTSWRSFKFFDFTPIKDPSSPDEGLLYSDPLLAAICPGEEHVYFATNNLIKRFGQSLQLDLLFEAYEQEWSITFLRYLSGSNLLLSLAERLGTGPIIKLWDLEKIDKKTGAPYCHSIVNVSNKQNTFPVSCLAISSDYSILALGFGDGTVILVRGDIIHDRGSRQRVVYESSTPITGLQFNETGPTPMLYVCSVGRVLTVPTTGRNQGKPDTVLDKSNGADLHCTDKDLSGKLVIGRADGIFYYSTSRKGDSVVLDVPKRRIFIYQQYIVIVTPSSSPSNGLSSLYDSNDDSFDINRILIVDIVNKYIAYTGQLAHGVKEIFVQWNKLWALGSDGILYSFEEKPLSERLDILVQRELFDVAIQLATSLNSPKDTISQVHKQFADYLYQQQNLSDAITHYIDAIDLGETSQVILKYRDYENIVELTRYLEAIHLNGLATKEHTTLLINSYAKQKREDKLKEFIENADTEDGNNANFDAEAAIQICRQNGYYALAAFLAKRIEELDLAVQINIKDLGNYKGCLAYIRSLPVEDALRILIHNSQILLDQFPNETTALLIDLFTGKFVPSEEESKEEPKEDDSSVAEVIAAPVLQSYRAFVNYMRFDNASETSNTNGNGRDTAIQSPSVPTYQPPSPRLIFPSFVNHPNEFVIFLEACIECYDEFGGNNKNRTDLLSTLFEMYLNLADDSGNSEEKIQWETKATNLGFSSDSSIDQNTILLLSHLSSFHDEELLTRNNQGYDVDLFRSCMASKDTQGAIKLLHKYGDREKELYTLALSYFTSSKEILEEAGEEFNFVLQKIKQERLLAPLQIIQALSVNSVATIGMIREYLIEIIDRENTDIENNRKLTENYRAETEAKNVEIDKLLNDPMVVQYTLCASCNTSLDLPAVHFACKHSYHQRCLNSPDDNNPQCPRCLPDFEAIKAIRRAQDDSSDRQDLFTAALEDSDSKFKVITDFFGRGAMEQAKFVVH